MQNAFSRGKKKRILSVISLSVLASEFREVFYGESTLLLKKEQGIYYRNGRRDRTVDVFTVETSDDGYYQCLLFYSPGQFPAPLTR